MKVFTNIKQLIGVATPQNEFAILENAFLIIEKNKIVTFGTMQQWQIHHKIFNGEVVDVSHKSILPTWVDSHTHLVFAADRADEFVQKIEGKTYAEIAASGGGILNSAKKIATISFDALYQKSVQKLKAVIALGTGAIEIKSGYGLTLAGELKMLQVIKKLKENFSINIKSTFLGAHALPLNFANNKAGYIAHIINDMLPIIAKQNLADYIDVFCEAGFFTNADTIKIAEAGKKYGMPLKLHANQLSNSGAVQTAILHGAVSVDHLEQIDAATIIALKNSNTIPVALPAAAMFLQLPYPPAKAMLQAGLPLAIATDYNPGSAPSGNMHYSVCLACIGMRIMPLDAIKAATLNGAKALQLQPILGNIAVGKLANFIITKKGYTCNSIPYKYGTNFIDTVIINGTAIK